MSEADFQKKAVNELGYVIYKFKVDGECYERHDMRNRSLEPREGHNPLGGSMVLFLLLMLVAVVLSGWLLTWDRFWGEGWLEDLHELLATIVMGAVLVHVSAVFIMGALTGIPLLRAMITGKRPVQLQR